MINDQFRKKLESSLTGTKEKEDLLSDLLNPDKDLLISYLKQSPDCKEIITNIDQINNTLNEQTKPAVSLNLNETNLDLLLKCIERAIKFFEEKLQQNRDESDEFFNLGLRESLQSIYSAVLERFNNLIKKCLSLKSNSPKTMDLIETCVRILTLCVNHSINYANQIAVEYNHFNEHKNWLEKCLLQKQTTLRESSIKFLLSFLKYAKTALHGASGQLSHETRENLSMVKKVFLNNQEQAISNGKRRPKAPPVPTMVSL